VDKFTIIGGGFSALIAKLLIGDRPHQIISAITAPTPDEHQHFRRPEFELNKLLSSGRALSLGTLQSQLSKGLLHDRLVHGGNSQIWGGFCNAGLLKPEIISLLNDHHIHLEPLSFARTGSISNQAGLSQLTEPGCQILNAAHLLGPNIEDAYVTKLTAASADRIEIELGNNAKPIFSEKVILAVGTLQLIDLLYRSGLIRDGDQLSLTEFEHNLRIMSTLKPGHLPQEDCVIRYQLPRALYHALGVQQIPNWLNRMALPVYIDQTFHSHSQELDFQIVRGVLQEIPSPQGRQHAFGGSIHYCNLRINGVDINILLNTFYPHLIVLGMPALCQKQPGPISNDIMNDAAIKISSI